MDDIVRNTTRVLEKYERQVLFAYLFGSSARGESTPSSDVDLAVFFAGGTREAYFETRPSLYADLCRALKRNDVDVVVLNTAVNLVLLEEIVRTGVVLYDRGPEMRTVFELETLHRSLDFKSQRLAVLGV